MMVGLQVDNGFFPVSGHAYGPASTPPLAATIRGAYLFYVNAIESLNRVFNLDLIGSLIYLKGISTPRIGKMHALFGDQRFHDNVIIIHSYHLHLHTHDHVCDI